MALLVSVCMCIDIDTKAGNISYSLVNCLLMDLENKFTVLDSVCELC
jgi:hypothetical protein